MFLTDLITYVQSLSCPNGSNIEVEVKILLDSRIASPNFIDNKCKGSDNISNIKSKLIHIINNALMFGSCNTTQTINFIHNFDKHISIAGNRDKSGNFDKSIKTDSSIAGNRDKSGGMFIKQLCFNDQGVQNKDLKNYYTKKPLIKPIYMTPKQPNDLAYKISVNIETIQSDDINNFNIIRFRLRYSIKFTEKYIGWQLDITFIKETTNKDLSVIKSIKDKMFSDIKPINNLISDFDWDYPDRVEVEIEYIGDIKKFNIGNIAQIKSLLYAENITTSYKNYQECICEIAQLLKPALISDFKSGKFGLKQLGSNPVELNKCCYSTILPNIDNFIVTEKIDGIRSMLMIYPDICYIITNDLLIKTIDVDYNHAGEFVCIILDAESYEYVNSDGSIETRYYIFDVIKYETKCETKCETICNKLPFIKRLEYVNIIVNKLSNILIDGNRFIYSKHFLELSKENYRTQLKDFYNDMINKNIKIDGLILISKDSNYEDTLNYKWKPITTIDFVAKKCPDSMLGISPYIIKENKTLYLLFCGIRRSEYKALGIEKMKSYDQLFSNTETNNYIPMQFSPSENPYAYLFWSNNNMLDSQVIELSYDINIEEWNLVKIRNDRIGDLNRKTYYGNYFKYAELIWMNYKNILSFDILCQPDSITSYFESESTDYIAMRKFNNFVKQQVIQQHSKSVDLKWVIELASGRGQDLSKYTECKFQNILFTDIDYDALTEIVNRKYTYISGTFDKHISIAGNSDKYIKTAGNSDKHISIACNRDKYSKIYLKKINLLDNYKINISSIFEKKYNVPNSGVQFVVCNLALHYIIPNKSKIINFVNMLNGILALNGIFIFTAFNGEKVFDLLQNNADINGYWNMHDASGKLIYSIKKLYKDNIFTGNNQQISVLLPFTNGKYYTENLININELNKQLEKKKINQVSCNSFEVFIDKFKLDKTHFYNQLSSIDKHYISLYNFYVYCKCKTIKTIKTIKISETNEIIT